MKKIYSNLIAVVVCLLITGVVNAQTQLVTDGGFETGLSGTAWTQSSTNFGTPLCDLASCGNGTGTGPRTGTYWAWFGGIAGTTETGTVSQSFVIPSGGTVSLTFWLEQIVCDGAMDFLDVKVDGNTVFSTNGASALCGVLGYSMQTVNLSSYADGNSHTLLFTSTTFSANTAITNFFVDDISVMHSGGGGGNCPNIIVDGSFETGPGGTAWTQTSTNFGTPLCDLASCGNGTGTGPRTGTYWAWFGGIAGTTETGTVSQSVVFPAGDSITLKFYLEQIICDGPMDFLEVKVDGNQVFSTNGSSSLCGTLGYSLQSINLSAYADGNSHTILFNSTTFSVNGGTTNFFVDDIVLESCSNNPPGPACTDTTAFTGLSVPIPDNDPTGATSSQVVSGVSGTTLGSDVKLVGVCFKINHTWVGDLIVTVTAPNATSVVLMDRPGVPVTTVGCSGDNVDVCVELGTGNEMENVCNNLPAISGNYTAANGTNLNAINTAGGSPNGTWQLFVTDNAGIDTGNIIEWKLIFDHGPVANWTPFGPVCASATPVNLNTYLTGTPGGTWSGNGVTGNTFNPTGLSGPVTITYMVSDMGTGCSDSESHDVTVVSGAPVASFSTSVVSLTVNFTNTSTGGVTYLWDFGDGSTSTAANPSHTYATGGTYTVTLTVTNACGNNVTSTQVTVQNCPDIIVDGSFEVGTPSAAWTETSTNFGTPLCDLASCGNGTGTGPRTGNFWAWFGGIAAFEEGSVSQSITIPVNSTASLSFWLEQITCDSPSDFLKIAVDADTVYTTTGANPICGMLGYTQQTVNLDTYADGNPHTLKFFSRIYGLNGNGTNFFVDDITLTVCTNIGIPESYLNQHISIAPVPASEFVEIRFNDIVTNNVKIDVFDMVGKNVYNTTVRSVNDDQAEKIDITSWSKGVYTVKISASGNTIIRKIVVQ